MSFGLLALLAASAVAGDVAVAGWSDGLTLVDRLAWSEPASRVERFADGAHEPEAIFAASWREGWAERAERLEGATIYAVEARLDGDARWLTVREAVVWTNRSQVPVDRLALRVAIAADGSVPMGRLAVWIDGRPVPFHLGESLLEVALPEPVRPGERVRMLLTIDGAWVPPFVDDDEYVEAINAVGTGAWGRSGGVVNLAYWLPLVTPMAPDGTQDRRPMPDNGEHAWFEPALFHVILDVPRHLEVATTGVELERRVSNGRLTLRTVAAGVREYAAEASRFFDVREQEVDGIRVRAFHRGPARGPTGEVWLDEEGRLQVEPIPGSPARPGSEQLLEWTLGALRFYERLWGPLPYREIDVVDAPVAVALGVEFPQLFTVDLGGFGAAHESDQRWTVAHEVAHQWWYAEVGNDPYAEPWVDEALAAQAAALYTASIEGEATVAERFRREAIEPYEDLVASGVAILPAHLEAGRFDLLQYSLLVYGKAALFLEEVRELLGSERYHGALRRYHEQHRLGAVTGADLLSALREAADEPAAVDELYRRWMAEVHHYDELLGGP